MRTPTLESIRLPLVRHGRSGEINLVKIIIGLVLLSGAYWAYAFLPHYWAAMKMDEVVQVTALYYRDNPHSEEKVREKYERELDIRDIPLYFEPDWCSIYDYARELHVECWWDVTVDVPALGPKVVEFYIHKYVDPTSGELYDISDES